MRPAPKFDRVIDSDRLAEAGLRLMEQAEARKHLPAGRRLALFRNGLMIAMLATCPIRLKNFAALTIDETLRRIDYAWIITLPFGDTKANRADERRIPAFVADKLAAYLLNFRRPVELRENVLWIGRTGRPLSYAAIERVVTETCRRALGKKIGPHLFRNCGASTAYRYARESPGLASALLHHTDSRVTERHYNRARCVAFAGEFLKIIDDL